MSVMTGPAGVVDFRAVSRVLFACGVYIWLVYCVRAGDVCVCRNVVHVTFSYYYYYYGEHLRRSRWRAGAGWWPTPLFVVLLYSDKHCYL